MGHGNSGLSKLSLVPVDCNTYVKNQRAHNKPTLAGQCHPTVACTEASAGIRRLVGGV